MESLKRYIIILCIFIVILIGIIGIIHYIEKQLEEKREIEERNQAGDISKDISTEMEKLDDYTIYNSIEKMMQNFYLYGRVQNKTGIYSLIDIQYAKENNINIENFISELSLNQNTENQFKVKEIHVMQDLDYPTYFIKINNKKDIKQKMYYIMYMDNERGTFAIEPISEENYNSYVKGDILWEIKENKIERNDYNKILRRGLSDDEIAKKYFDDYIENALYSIEEAYNSIDEEYRKIRFGNIEEYKKYLHIKHDQLISMGETNIKIRDNFKTEDEYHKYLNSLKGLYEYKIIRGTDNTKYICIDEYKNYYIFNSTTAFQYTVMLDNYTIPTEDFTETYNSSSEPEKVVLNIKRFFMGIDDKNYGYSYSVLSEAFKNNNYPTKNDFINYVKQNFFEENEIEYIKYEKENGLYIYKIKIKDATGKSAGEKELNMILKLKSGTDFEMSFGEN